FEKIAPDVHRFVKLSGNLIITLLTAAGIFDHAIGGRRQKFEARRDAQLRRRDVRDQAQHTVAVAPHTVWVDTTCWRAVIPQPTGALLPFQLEGVAPENVPFVLHTKDAA